LIPTFFYAAVPNPWRCRRIELGHPLPPLSHIASASIPLLYHLIFRRISIASVSIALQLAEVALKLHRFWNRVEDAPKEMNDLLNDLMILKDVLRDIHVQQRMIPGPPAALPAHRPLLKCSEHFEELENLAKKLQLDSSNGVIKRKWKAMKVVFRKDQVLQLRSNIEAMKITLVLARQSLET
jgi:hypothetical protein